MVYGFVLGGNLEGVLCTRRELRGCMGVMCVY